MMTHKEGRFGVSDVEYNIVTTLSNLLQAEDVLNRYAKDAEEAGESEVSELFRELEQVNNQFASRLRDRLKTVLDRG
jgi:rubrerythrin